MQEPNSSPSRPSADPDHPRPGLAEHGSNAITSVVGFYIAALESKEEQSSRLRAKLTQVSTLQRQYIDDNDRLRKELGELKTKLEQQADGIYHLVMRTGDLVRELEVFFKTTPKGPNDPEAHTGTRIEPLYRAWLALQPQRELVSELVPQRDDPIRTADPRR